MDLAELRTRRFRREDIMQTLLQDLRYGWRMLARNPGPALIAIVARALGIGASTANFGVVNDVLLQRLPYPEPERLLTVYESGRDYTRGGRAFQRYSGIRAKEEAVRRWSTTRKLAGSRRGS